mgnify:CR=1 FL=1
MLWGESYAGEVTAADGDSRGAVGTNKLVPTSKSEGLQLRGRKCLLDWNS